MELRQQVAKIALRAFQAYTKHQNDPHLKLVYAEVQGMLTVLDKIIEPEDEFYAFIETYEERIASLEKSAKA